MLDTVNLGQKYWKDLHESNYVIVHNTSYVRQESDTHAYILPALQVPLNLLRNQKRGDFSEISDIGATCNLVISDSIEVQHPISSEKESCATAQVIT